MPMVAESFIVGTKFGLMWATAETMFFWREDGIFTLKQGVGQILNKTVSVAMLITAFGASYRSAEDLREKNDTFNIIVGGSFAYGLLHLSESMPKGFQRHAAVFGATGALVTFVSYRDHRRSLKA
ncbi:hypothetical protein AAMO2058_001611600 [Amorphochlora amoebiformis]